MVDVDGKPQRTLPKDVTLDVVTERPLHVDFLRISKNAKVTVSIPVRFVDEEKAPGIKRGGVLNIVRHELELVLDAAHIPDEIAISLEGRSDERRVGKACVSTCRYRWSSAQ